MRLSRIVPVAAAGALLAAATVPAHAQEPEVVEGVGTTTGSLTLLGLDAGDLLSLDLLSDAGVANTDESAGAVSAAAQIAAFALESPALGLAESVPLFAVESTGEPQEASQDVALPTNPAVSGAALPLSLSALVGEDGARSGLTAALADLDVLGGILSLAGAELDLAGDALAGDAAASRNVSVQDLELLDLEALLAGLGIPLTDLPLDSLLGLLEGLGLGDQVLAQLQPLLDQLGLDALGDLGDLPGLVDDLLGQVLTLEDGLGELELLEENLTDDLGDTVCEVTGGVGDVLDDLLGGIGGGGTGSVLCDVTDSVTEQLQVVQDGIDELTTRLDAVLDQLTALLEQLTGTGGALDLLGATSLLSLDGLDVSVLTKATDDVATSVADVTADLGSVQVGALPSLGVLDLDAGADQVQALLGQVEAAIGGVLGQIAPSLSDLVSVTTLQEQSSVVEEAGRVVATADFTGLVVEVQPILGELEAVLGGLGGADSLGAVLGDLGLPVPTSGAADVLALNSLLAPVTDGLPLLGGLAALDEALTLRVASMRQESVFAAAAVPATPGAPGAPTPQAPAPTLPRTGSSDTLVLALAVAAAAVALGGRHLVRRSAG